ncbi:universal stress protein [Fulvivirga kasyanovii]|uniref:Universal stress protein n=1 Tax=Fulvivirga kasyanovii TaxID=396812 RepID=A0ABW9RJ86_9BACT|nr:universal stress protein [Fulvivirga kasyanovii]MTI24143.1 universal stress protein [Fulvivirga kasyanovii]
MFHKIAIAIAFSPRLQTLLAEAKRTQELFKAELLLIHVGTHTDKDDLFMKENLQQAGLDNDRVHVVWESGNPASEILAACRREKVDLLVAGALKKEDFITYYLGSVARKILRKADCSVLMITEPSAESNPFEKIVVHAENSPYAVDAIKAGVYIGKLQKAKQLHIVREIKLYGLAMSVSGELTEEELSETRRNMVNDEIQNVEKILKDMDVEGLKINIKVMSGKSGFELAKFCSRVDADLLVVGSPHRKLGIFDRMFPHDLEYIFADLPCDLLILHPRKK